MRKPVARGFHSWIDQQNDLVFTFATDLSHFANVEILSSMMHATILDAVPAADFDLDGTVDGGDLAIWKAAFGATRAGDANSDGISDGADFLIWQREYASDAGAPSSLSIPEPTGIALVLLAMAPLTFRRP